MKRFMIATATAAALMAGVGAASAQTWYDDGYYHAPRGPFVERSVGLQIGPFGAGVYAERPAWNDDRRYGYGYSQRDVRDDSPAYNSYGWSQTPRDGGY